ncbi:MAG: hypothetical protein LBI05_06615 [Planctomycetaceae bacterium]|jgi:HEAT repeat protein|nr:hypothetical protein [Planctomycetaceae bacterium]
MTQFQEKTIKFIGKSENPAAVEILLQLLGHLDSDIRKQAFLALYLKKNQGINVLLFKQFLKDEGYWGDPDVMPTERLAKIADAALRDPSKKYRQTAAEAAMKYKLYEVVPTVVLYCESQDREFANLMRTVLLQLAESFYEDIVNAPAGERRNFDRKREWFVSQLDAPIKRYSISANDEAIQALLIVTRNDFDLMKLAAADSRSPMAKKMGEYLRTGTNRSFIRVLLNYTCDPDSPGTMDQIISERSDPLFVRKLLEFIGPDPNSDFRATLKRFQDIAWFRADNPELPGLVADLEPNAVQLLESANFPKDRVIPLYRFFLERESVESRRAAAKSARWLVGEEINQLLLSFLDNSDAQTAAILFRLLKAREVAGVDKILPALIERPEPEILQAIFDMMPELHVEAFASHVNQMTPLTAQRTGRYVRLVDPKTSSVIEDDIKSPIPIRRTTACKVAMVTGYAKDFLPRIIEIAEYDDEMTVRLAAISALSTVLTKESLETLKKLSADKSTSIRDAVELAIKDWATEYRTAKAAAEKILPSGGT